MESKLTPQVGQRCLLPGYRGAATGNLDRTDRLCSGRIPPYLSKELIYAVNNIRKYPIPDDEGKGSATVSGDDHSWVMVGNEADKDVLYFL